MTPLTKLQLDQDYWDDRYNTGNISWDVGKITTPIKEYINQLTDKSLKILIPGAGNAYEAVYLFNYGFKNSFVLDISAEAIVSLKERVPWYPSDHIFHQDFFDHEGSYDLIIEQTFFCAIDPELRTEYANKMHQLLVPGGKLVGLLWNDVMCEDSPPYGGSKEEYLSLFEPYFQVKVMSGAYNSISPRAGRELFINLVKK
ncbi:methyltransferase domain-containing protein [Marinoscillum furvescens]|uniref:Thiopurine S-methyltransferase n=1 Tax=Marinoscillum furvescens DSM 4134 TaxID=1122208 RepID=A0A3D9L417_MARFU|nr:methyltransferase domain-containing protein [Marinoscillum furvescens]RED98014.1 thiopurine S-methyltransferase [Marinoscillum furvescens DSM 4134]